MTIEEDITTLIVNAGLGTPSTTFFIGTRPFIPEGDGPFLAVAVTPGGGPEWNQNQNTPRFRKPGCAVTAVGKSAVLTKALIESAWNVFCKHNTTVNSTFYIRMVPTQEPFELPLDPAKNRARFRFNVLFEFVN